MSEGNTDMYALCRDCSALLLFNTVTCIPVQAAYDKILKAREAAKVRHRELDSKRKKFKEGNNNNNNDNNSN